MVMKLNKKSNTNKIIKFIQKHNSSLLIIISILIVLLTILNTSITYAANKKNIGYEKNISSELSNVNVYNSKNISINQKDSKASRLSTCLKEAINVESLNDEIKNVINNINNYFNSSTLRYSYKYYDIYSGFSVSYNEESKIFTASTIKAPTCIYIYEMASEGNIDLNKELLYTSNYYNPGAGVIKNGEVNTYYSVDTLVQNAITYSDNIAHTMLFNYIGREKLENFWNEKGTDAIFRLNTPWGENSAHDAVIYFNELYNFYLNNDEYGTKLMNLFLNNNGKFFIGPDNLATANKSGYAGSVANDVAIVFDENPYIVVAMSNLADYDYMTFFKEVGDLTYQLHKAYWNYKMEKCLEI